MAEDVLRDECAVFGCVSKPPLSSAVSVKEIIYLGLLALQHRGQESSGMVLHDGKEMVSKKGMGLVSNVYAELPTSLEGDMGIGHNRYSTAGNSSLLNAQPFVVHTVHGQIAVAHNGQLVNAAKLREGILHHGVGLYTESDSEVMTQLLARELSHGETDDADFATRIMNFMNISQCSYSALLMTSHGRLFAFRDPFGNRPLCLGEMHISQDAIPDSPFDSPPKKMIKQEDTIYLVSSESCAFSSIGANKVRDVSPGEIVLITENGFKTVGMVSRPNHKSAAFCIFEYVYFARADTYFQGNLVHMARCQCGRQLALEAPAEADIVSTIPDSATPAALGFSEISGIPYCDVLVKNRYVGRTFIQPNSYLRKRGVMTKFGPLIDNAKGKKIVLIDDSIVRGNTMSHIVDLLKSAGAVEVHIRIASPPLRHPCFMGVNIPTKEELIANQYDCNALAKKFGATSLAYLSVEGLLTAIEDGIKENDKNNIGHCTACLTGKYPVELEW